MTVKALKPETKKPEPLFASMQQPSPVPTNGPFPAAAPTARGHVPTHNGKYRALAPQKNVAAAPRMVFPSPNARRLAAGPFGLARLRQMAAGSSSMKNGPMPAPGKNLRLKPEQKPLAQNLMAKPDPRYVRFSRASTSNGPGTVMETTIGPRIAVLQEAPTPKKHGPGITLPTRPGMTAASLRPGGATRYLSPAPA